MLKVTLLSGEVVEGDNAAELMNFVAGLVSRPKLKLDKRVQKEATRVASKEIKRKYTKSKKDYSFWTGEELYFVSRNLGVTTKKLAKELRNRTQGAIGTVKWEMKHNKLSANRAKVLSDYMKSL